MGYFKGQCSRRRGARLAKGKVLRGEGGILVLSGTILKKGGLKKGGTIRNTCSCSGGEGFF